MTAFDLKGSVIKSIQRGSVASAGTININRVNPNKTIVISSGKGSAGSVAANGNISVSGNIDKTTGGSGGGSSPSSSTFTGTLSGGTTSGLYAGQYSATLASATTLTADGACNYQVIEYR